MPTESEFTDLAEVLKKVHSTKNLSDDGTVSGRIYYVPSSFNVIADSSPQSFSSIPTTFGWDEALRHGEWIKKVLARPSTTRMVNREAARRGLRSGVVRKELGELLWKLDYEALTGLERPAIRNWVSVAGRYASARSGA